MRIFAARPKPPDAALNGVPCHAILGVGDAQIQRPSIVWHLVILDCRAMEDGWQTWCALDGFVNLDELLSHFSQDAPLGWHARVACERQAGFLHTIAGQVLVLFFEPVEHSRAEGSRARAHTPGSEERQTSSPAFETRNDAAASSSDRPAPAAPDQRLPEACPSVEIALHGEEVAGPPLHFLLLTPGYVPELVSVLAAPPVSLEEVRHLIGLHRAVRGSFMFPRLVLAEVQPALSFACVLALPEWEPTGIPVLIVCFVPPVRLFSVIAPTILAVPEILRLAGVEGSDVHLYVSDVPWALTVEARYEVSTGDLIMIFPADHPRIPPLALTQMLSSSEGWHSEPFLPGPFERRVWVQTSHACFRVPYAHEATTPLRELFATQTGNQPEDHVILPAGPAIRDHDYQGLPSLQVFLAAQPSQVDVHFFLDLRPILLDIVFVAARGGRVDVADICMRYRALCPRGYCIRLLGGSSPPGAANHVRYVHPGQVITIEFHVARSSVGQGSHFHPPPPDDEERDEDQDDDDPHDDGVQPEHTALVRVRDAGTGGVPTEVETGSNSAAMFEHRQRPFSNRVDKWNGSYFDHAFPEGHCWDTSASCYFLLLRRCLARLISVVGYGLCLVLECQVAVCNLPLGLALAKQCLIGLWPLCGLRILGSRDAMWSGGFLRHAFREGGHCFTPALLLFIISDLFIWAFALAGGVWQSFSAYVTLLSPVSDFTWCHAGVFGGCAQLGFAITVPLLGLSSRRMLLCAFILLALTRPVAGMDAQVNVGLCAELVGQGISRDILHSVPRPLISRSGRGHKAT